MQQVQEVGEKWSHRGSEICQGQEYAGTRCPGVVLPGPNRGPRGRPVVPDLLAEKYLQWSREDAKEELLMWALCNH